MAFESFPNPAADTPSGAGIQTAQFVMGKQPQALLTGHLGTNAFQVVEAGGFSAYAVSDTMTVREAVERFNAGDLDPIQSPGASGRGKGRGRRGR
jgi:predicted Fe-Mo cluster-binding NifX family protein